MSTTANLGREAERDLASCWARDMLERSGWLMLDTETTGLDETAEVIEVAVLCACCESVAFHGISRPTRPIPAEATAVHGYTDASLKDALAFAELYDELAETLRGKIVVTYNAAYDRRILAQTCKAHNLPELPVAGWQCAMEMYAAWHGQWSERHQSYRYQPLTGGDHSALGDCRAALKAMLRMATV